MSTHYYPILFEVQTRATLHSLSVKMKRKATLEDIPDKLLDEWKKNGFEWIWLMGIWQTGQAGRKISRSKEEWQEEFRSALDDLKDSDITGSPYAVKEYKVHSDFGGDKALASFRERLHKRGLKLMLDFVPNHTAQDHPWVKDHPDFFLQGREEELKAEPGNYITIKTGTRKKIFALGRDPNYPGWPDTLQLDYSNPDLQKAMKEVLLDIAGRCDGLRCDMAMLLLPDIFEKTWRRPVRSFWPSAIENVRDEYPEFLFLAEVYWDLEWEMQQLGFDFCYDKRLYDRLLYPYAPAIADHLRADSVYQNRLARFLENHDEKRAALVFPGDMQQAAAVISYFSPGMKLFHQGQIEGYMVKIPVHLNRGPVEETNKHTFRMYERILEALKDDIFQQGDWRLLDCRKAWEDDPTFINFLAFCWQDPGVARSLVTVNYSPTPSRCYVAMPFPELAGEQWRFTDRLSDVVYEYPGQQLISEGLYLDMPGWGVHVFRVDRAI